MVPYNDEHPKPSCRTAVPKNPDDIIDSDDKRYQQGRHETVDSEPGLYRHTEISGEGFRAFELTSLLPKTGFDLHIAKMAE